MEINAFDLIKAGHKIMLELEYWDDYDSDIFVYVDGEESHLSFSLITEDERLAWEFPTNLKSCTEVTIKELL